jgi:hypothetical protein
MTGFGMAIRMGAPRFVEEKIPRIADVALKGSPRLGFLDTAFQIHRIRA